MFSSRDHQTPAATRPSPPTQFDQLRLERQRAELRESQNLGLGLVGGMAGAAVGATLWAVITALTKFQIGWMAVGVGFLVGYGVRTLGKGVDPRFGYMGGLLSLVGCAAGNLLAVCIVVSQGRNIPLLDLLARLDPRIALALLQATFQPLDLLFYGLAVYEGYKLSFGRLPEPPVPPAAV